MTRPEARDILVEAFLDTAPECDPTAIPPDAPYREVLSIDSIDFLSILEAVARESGVEIPEADYDKIQTFDDFIGYLIR